MNIRTCLLVMSLLLATRVSAQSYISLSLRDADRHPISGAVVTLTASTIVGRTDQEGKVILRLDQPSGTYAVQIVAGGFYTRDTTLTPGVHTITLLPISYQLPAQWVYTAQRQEVAAADVAETVTVLDAAHLLRLSPRSVPEALLGMPGVWMQKTNHGGGSPFVRGLTGNQTLLLLDGIRLNNATYRYGPNQYLNTVDALSLERIEVMHGAGSVQYGSDALGGVVHLFTPTPTLSTEGIDVHTRLYGKWMNYDMEQTVRAEASVSTPYIAARLGGSIKSFGDLRAGGQLGVQSPSSYDEYAGDFKALVRLSPTQRLTLAWNGLRQRNVDRYDQVAQRGFAIWMFDPQERQMAWARWEINTSLPGLSQIRVTYNQQQNIEERTFQRVNNPVRNYERDEVHTQGTSLEVVSRWGRQAAWEAVSGVEAYRDRVGSTAWSILTTDSSRTDRRGLYPDGSAASSLSAFSLVSWRTGLLQLTGGARLSRYTVDIEDATFGDVDIAPTAAAGHLTARYGQRYQWIAAFNKGFRAPNINDLSTFGAFDSGIEVPVQSLKPEHSYTSEIGWRTTGTHLHVSVTGYYTWLVNLIVRAPATWQGNDSLDGDPVFQKQNIDRAFITGTEGNLVWQPARHWRITQGLAWAYGQNLTRDEPLSRIPPLHGRTVLQYEPLPSTWIALEGLYATMQDRLSGGDTRDHRIPAGGTPGWAIANLRAGYSLRWLDLSAGLQNILNAAYRVHGSGVDGYGRSVWVSARFMW